MEQQTMNKGSTIPGLPEVYQVLCPAPIPNEWNNVCEKACGDYGGGCQGYWYKITTNGKYVYKRDEWRDIPVITWEEWKAAIENHYSKKEEHSIKDVRVGDWVCMLKERGQGAKIGDVYQIGGNNPGNMWLKGVSEYPQYYVYNSDIRLATQQEIDKVNPPKVADTRKKLSFKTEDGYDLYKGDIVVWIHKSQGLWQYSYTLPASDDIQMPSVKVFHYRETADKWVAEQNQILQKPVMEELKEGDWVEVLDTLNVKSYDANAIGYKWQITENAIRDWKNGDVAIKCSTQKYGVNYRREDVKKIPAPVAQLVVPEPTIVTADNAYVGLRVQYKTGIYGDEVKKGEWGTITRISNKNCVWVKWDICKKELSHRFDVRESQVITTTQTIINQTNNTKTQNNGNINEEISNSKNYSSNKESCTSKESSKAEPASYIRIYPKVTSGQGYYTGKAVAATCKIKPKVTKGHHREYTRC